MGLAQTKAPRNDPDFVFEVKFDGFRVLRFLEAFRNAIRMAEAELLKYVERRAPAHRGPEIAASRHPPA
jgi:hypothetical protein